LRRLDDLPARHLAGRGDGLLEDLTIGPWRVEGVVAVLVLALLVQVFAGFALRGLYADGAFHVSQVIGHQSFIFSAPARSTVTFLVQAPEVTAVMLGVTAPQLIATSFSVTTNVLPGFVFLLCSLVLSRAEGQFFVFPAFVYFAGTLSAQFASVAEGLVSTAYVWLLFYLLMFGQLFVWRLGLILLLSVGAILLHEEMSFLGPVLIAAGWLRWRDATTRPAQLALGLAVLAIIISTAVGTWWALFPSAPPDRTDLISGLVHLRWLFVPAMGCNLPAALGLAAGMAILTCILVPRASRAVILTFFIISVGLAVASFWERHLTIPSGQYAARDNAAFLSFPLMILVLVAHRLPGILPFRPIPAIVMILGISVSLWHIQATEKWSAFLSDVRSVLASNNGIVPSPVLLNLPGTRGENLSRLMIWSWTNPDLSILILPRRCMTSVIANPPGVSWEPYDLQDPSTLPPIPGITYAYLMSPERQASACPPIHP
jgi:hypothetical protein